MRHRLSPGQRVAEIFVKQSRELGNMEVGAISERVDDPTEPAARVARVESDENAPAAPTALFSELDSRSIDTELRDVFTQRTTNASII